MSNEHVRGAELPVFTHPELADLRDAHERWCQELDLEENCAQKRLQEKLLRALGREPEGT